MLQLVINLCHSFFSIHALMLTQPLANIQIITFKTIKSKGVLRQAKVAQWVPSRLRPRIFLMFRHYKGGRSSAKCNGRLYPRRNPWYSLSEAELTSGHMVLSAVPRKKSLVISPGIDPGTVRLVAQCLNHYATQGPFNCHELVKYFPWLMM